PCDPIPIPVPAPPTANGDPATGVSVPSACRSNAATVFVPAVLSFPYTCPTPRGAAEALPAASAEPTTINASSNPRRITFICPTPFRLSEANSPARPPCPQPDDPFNEHLLKSPRVARSVGVELGS